MGLGDAGGQKFNFFFIIFIFQETCNRQNIYLHIQTFSYILSTYWSYIYIHISLVVLISKDIWGRVGGNAQLQ